MQEGKIGKKNMEMRLCYSAFRQFQFFHRSLESGLQYLQLNTTTALHCIHADNSKASVFSVANYHPRKVGNSVLKHDLMMSWAHLHMNKIADQEQIEAELSSRHSLISPAGLLCPTVMKPLSLCVQYRDTRSAVQGEGWLIRTIWKEQAISQNIYESGLVTSLLPNVWKSDVFPW